MENNLLIVDDNAEILEVIQELLAGLFDKITTANTVELAQEKLNSSVFNSIILDIHLEKRNGAEIIKYLVENPKNKNSKCPIIILSGIINLNFIEKNKERFAAIVIKPFDGDQFVETIKNILSETSSNSFDELPIPNCELPFPVPQLQEKVSKMLDQVKKNNKLKQLFSELKINRNSDDFLMVHIGMLINVSTGISSKLEWNTDKTLEKFVYAAYLHDMALVDRPDLAKISATAIELEIMKEKINPNDFKLLFDHATIAAKRVDEIIEIPQDVGIMIRQHHELPKENGFPMRLPFGKITPLSTVFIVSHDLVHYILENPKWTMKEYLVKVKTKFRGPHFAKVIASLHEIS